jgi:hypothetical protein
VTALPISQLCDIVSHPNAELWDRETVTQSIDKKFQTVILVGFEKSRGLSRFHTSVLFAV